MLSPGKARCTSLTKKNKEQDKYPKQGLSNETKWADSAPACGSQLQREPAAPKQEP